MAYLPTLLGASDLSKKKKDVKFGFRINITHNLDVAINLKLLHSDIYLTFPNAI